MRCVSVLTVTAALVVLAETANAHPQSVSASPAANATVAWQIVSTDTHKTAGIYTFAMK
ncbi:copper resistance protein CopC [Sphingomonas paucimobilis]|jgi:methionine-rich copper-binding protein CopC|nr:MULTISPECIES: copper resistance protein CopC [Sphingomonas]MCM3681402.1 copper resistance protein CopC [Sphingomonas paucimobilis]